MDSGYIHEENMQSYRKIEYIEKHALRVSSVLKPKI